MKRSPVSDFNFIVSTLSTTNQSFGNKVSFCNIYRKSGILRYTNIETLFSTSSSSDDKVKYPCESGTQGPLGARFRHCFDLLL